MTLLEISDLDTYYGPSQVLHGTALTVAQGQVVGVVGRNGMGKSTLVHTIMGFLRPRRGRIVFKGKQIGGLVPEKICAAGISLVPQERRVFGSLTVGENLHVSYRTGKKKNDQEWTIDEVCDRISILGERWNQLAGQMSGGQQQLLAIGRALLSNSDLVLMDEPTEGLDQFHLAAVVGTVRELARRGTAVLLVEQKLRVALELTESLHIMDRGEMVYSTPTKAVRGDPSVVMDALGFVAASGGPASSETNR